MITGLLTFPALIGLFVIWHIARPQHAPADTSNRLNKLRLLWYALTREDELARAIDWLRQDESDIAPLPGERPNA
jgi:hypothetical protein